MSNKTSSIATVAAAITTLLPFVAGAVPSVKVGTAQLVKPDMTNTTIFPAWSAPTASVFGATPPKEIVELARALRNNPDLIYDYVRNNVETAWMYGLQKGAVGAIIDKSGTSFDQAELMFQLLRQAGFTSASYKIGTITITGAQFEAWTGISATGTNAAVVACQLLASGGIPASVNGSTAAVTDCASLSGTLTSVQLVHAWISVKIPDNGSTTYVFDPSYKPHTFKAGINLATAASMTTGQAMTQVATGMTSGNSTTTPAVPYVVNLGSEALNTTLQGYANNILTQINTNYPAAEIEDIVGGAAITPYVAPVGGLRQTTLAGYTASSAQYTWTGDIPNAYRTALTVVATKADCVGNYPTIVNTTLYADDIYGYRLTLGGTFQNGGKNSVVSMELRDEQGLGIDLYSQLYSCNPGFNVGDLTLTVNHPYPASADYVAGTAGTYMDTTTSKSIKFAARLTIVHGWGDAGRGLVDKIGTRMDDTLRPLVTDGCELCLTQFHAQTGASRREQLAASWLAQSSTAARLHAAIAKSLYQHHHSIGVVEGETEIEAVNKAPNGGTPDFLFTISDNFDRLDIESGISLTSKTNDAVARRAGVHAIAATMDALEASTSAQASDLPDTTSTATKFEWGNRPPAAEDPAPAPNSGTPRRFYDFSSTNSSQATNLVKLETKTSTTDDGWHGPDVPEIGATEFSTRKIRLTGAITSYTAGGYKVVASEEMFLGPGQRAGSFDNTGGSETVYNHAPSKQRSGAFVATRYAANGLDPLDIAHVTVGPDVSSKGGGGGAQTSHQAQYDPSVAADILKSRFVDRSKMLGVDMLSGGVTAESPASITVGNGGFPYELSASLIWVGGNQRSLKLGPVAHSEPQQPWTTNWNNTLTVSGSGMEMMGEGDIRATAGTIAAFLAAQDAYKSAVTAQREVAGALINAWWVKQLTGSVVTVNVGASTRQFVKLVNGTWIATGPGPYATLTQTGSRAVYEEPSCSPGIVTFVMTRGWNYAGMSFAVTNANGDVQNFQYWSAPFTDGGSYCADLHGFRMSSWTFPQGVTINLVYTFNSGQGNAVPELSEVNNSLGRKIVFVNSGRGGFNNGLTAGNLRSVGVSGGDADGVGTITHTEPNGTSFNKYIVTLVGEKYLLTQIFNAENGTNPATQYDYDTLRRVKEGRDAVALQVGGRNPYQFFLADGVRGERVDPAGGTYTVFYDRRQRPYGYMDELGRTTTTVFDGRSRVTQYIYPEGDREVLKYDNRNNPIELAKWPKGCAAEPCSPAAIKVTADWHTTWNKPNWINDAKGNRTDFVYYASGNGASLMQTATRAAASVGGTRPVYGYTYNNRGKVLTATDPTSVVVSNTYDPTNQNLLTSTLDPGTSPHVAAVTTYTYDAIGNTSTVTDPRLNAVEFIYDVLGRKTQTKHYSGSVAGCALLAAEKSDYDILGRVTFEYGATAFSGCAVTTWQMRKSRTYTKNSKMFTEGNGAGNTTTYTYDAMDRVFDVDDPVHRHTRFEYNLAGDTLREIRAYGTALQQDYGTYTYTLNGQRATVKDANNNLSTLEYDGFDRLIKLRMPMPTFGANASSTTDYEQYGYDANGNRTSVRKRDGQTINFIFDNLDRETLKDIPGGTVDDVYSDYDLAGRTVYKRFGSTGGQGIDYAYADTAKRLTAETSFGRALTFQYDANGNRTRITHPDTNYMSYDYDALNRMTVVRENGATSGAGVLVTYAWDTLSRRSATTPMSRGNSTTTSYGYDAASRLTTLGHNVAGATLDATVTLGYTLASQLNSRSTTNDAFGWWVPPSKVQAYVADGLNRYTNVNGTTYTYDTRGNLTSDGSRTFAYDVENRLTSVSGSASMTLTYDPLGRLRQTVAGATTTQFLYEGDHLVAEYNGSGALVRRYIHGGGIDEPIVWYEGSGLTDRRWLHQDERSSTIGYSDGTGAATPYKYGPYGEQTIGDPSSWTGSRFRYTGQLMLPEVQLYHYKARVYDPGIGRFLQTDPVGYRDDVNLYVYVNNDPFNNQDPTGKCFIGDCEDGTQSYMSGFAENAAALAYAAVDSVEFKASASWGLGASIDAGPLGELSADISGDEAAVSTTAAGFFQQDVRYTETTAQEGNSVRNSATIKILGVTLLSADNGETQEMHSLSPNVPGSTEKSYGSFELAPQIGGPGADAGLNSKLPGSDDKARLGVKVHLGVGSVGVKVNLSRILNYNDYAGPPK